MQQGKVKIQPGNVLLCTKDEVKSVIDEFKPKDPNHKLFWIDVRNPDEIHQTGIIKHKDVTAKNIPLPQIEQAFAPSTNNEEFKTKYGFDKPDKEDVLIFSCKAGTRSAKATEIVSADGYKHVINYTKGANCWFS